MRLVERLEDLDDVTRVYTNVHISDEVLAQATAAESRSSKGHTIVIETSREPCRRWRPRRRRGGSLLPRRSVVVRREQSLSFDDVVRGRMCDTCRAKVGQEVEERAPVFDKATGRMRFEVQQHDLRQRPAQVHPRALRAGQELRPPRHADAGGDLSHLPGQWQPPMTLEQVREQLAEWCPGGGCQWLLLPQEMVERLVQNDRHYGLRQTEAATAHA